LHAIVTPPQFVQADLNIEELIRNGPHNVIS
jgi:hypothetical protein